MGVGRVSQPDPATLPGAQRAGAHPAALSPRAVRARSPQPRHVRPRTRPPPAQPPTPRPRPPGTPAVPRPSRAGTRTLRSLHSVIRFLNLEAAQGPARDPRPHPLPEAGGPGPAVGSGPGWGLLVLGAPAGGWAKSAGTPPGGGSVGPHGATLGPPSPRPRCPPHLQPQLSSGAFSLHSSLGLGTQPRGGKVRTKEGNEWAQSRPDRGVCCTPPPAPPGFRRLSSQSPPAWQAAITAHSPLLRWSLPSCPHRNPIRQGLGWVPHPHPCLLFLPRPSAQSLAQASDLGIVCPLLQGRPGSPQPLASFRPQHPPPRTRTHKNLILFSHLPRAWRSTRRFCSGGGGREGSFIPWTWKGSSQPPV